MTIVSCISPSCDLPRHCRGYCKKHYGRLKRHGDAEVNLAPTRGMSVSERTLYYLDKGHPNECWPWKAAHDNNGYGFLNMRRNGRGNTAKAHRLVWELLVGPIGDGLELDHLCHNRGCCNPEHLREVTHKVNHENRKGTASHNTSGIRGVHVEKRTGNYVAYIRHHQKSIHIGTYKTAEEAIEARKRREIELFTPIPAIQGSGESVAERLAR